MDAKQFVKKIVDENQALFRASQHNVKAYFDSKPAQSELVEHFIGRMINERMNMVEIAQQVANMPADADPVELQLLTQQAHDEAVHFRLVKEVIEHIQGAPLDVQAAIAREAAKPTAKGAALLQKYGAETDPAALAAYQLVAEGRAEAVWNQMAECIEDEFISSAYAKIAKDEGFHSKIGARALEKLVTTDEDQKRISALVAQMRKDLYDISCKNTIAAEDGKKLVANAYGW
ncbi:Ferritin_like domain containing protein [uncultured Caudovirales phage]|uniref:ribonucleoside-diphosphate reductase n=1 Tax=uncultured Caudovirales phage TaxID=2100421 RepID=A0A6J5LKD9_9CAUD|nr:Ferritin_like domain containing protein [uncultured Caudovirales phage]